MLAFLLAACADDDKRIDLDDLETIEDVAEVCEDEEPETATLTVTFEETEVGCGGFGENGNLPENNGYISARTEQVESLDVGNVLLCGTAYEFQPNPEEAITMYYDDDFFFTFDDIVVASSNREAVEALDTDDNGFPIYDWQRLQNLPISTDARAWCLGQEQDEEQLEICTIPSTQSEGVVVLQYSDEITHALALRAIEEKRMDYGFITVGDNDPDVDCYHREFSFEVEIYYIDP
jgi:hypothetical protein